MLHLRIEILWSHRGKSGGLKSVDPRTLRPFVNPCFEWNKTCIRYSGRDVEVDLALGVKVRVYGAATRKLN
jgi:hypothetical protein